LSELEWPQHVSIDVNITTEIGVGEFAFIETKDGTQSILALEINAEAWRTVAEMPNGSIW
jgi:hypothetical protein